MTGHRPPAMRRQQAINSGKATKGQLSRSKSNRGVDLLCARHIREGPRRHLKFIKSGV
jgi:hypothetical protein